MKKGQKMTNEQPLFTEIIKLPENCCEKKPLLKALVWLWFGGGLIGFVAILLEMNLGILGNLFLFMLLCLWPTCILVSMAKWFTKSKQIWGHKLSFDGSHLLLEFIYKTNPQTRENCFASFITSNAADCHFDESSNDGQNIEINPKNRTEYRNIKKEKKEIPLIHCSWKEGFADNDSLFDVGFIPFFRKKAIEISFHSEKETYFGDSQREISILTCGYTKESFEQWKKILSSSNAKKLKNRFYWEPFFIGFSFLLGIYLDFILFWIFATILLMNYYIFVFALILSVYLPIILTFAVSLICQNEISIQWIKNKRLVRSFCLNFLIQLLSYWLLIFLFLENN